MHPDNNAAPHQTVFLKEYRPYPFRAEKIKLFFDLFDEEVVVTAETLFSSIETNGDQPLILNGEKLELLSLHIDGAPLSPDQYKLTENQLVLGRIPKTFTLRVVTRIYPNRNTTLEGLYRSGSMFCTQCEAEGFRTITFFPDRPDVLCRFTTTIAADRKKYPVLLSNGNCTERGSLNGERHFAVYEDPFPKPSYLFALVAGDLGKIEDRFLTISGRKVLLQIYTHHHHLDKCGHAMHSLKKAMRWDEETFGLEYDLDQYMIVAVDDFNMGAMENKGLNIFNSKYVLCRPDTATDHDYQAIEAVIAHEYFHNWTGNRVTCRDWFQLSLKEGLTVFRDQQFSGDATSNAVQRIEDVRLLRNTQFQEDASPMAHPVRPDAYMEINNFYTVTVYEKGAELIRMLHTLLGRELFRQGLKLYLERYDGQAATVEDFVQAMAEVSKRDLKQFSRWYTQAGTPRLKVTDGFHPSDWTYTLTIRQECPPTPGQDAKEPLHIPIAVGLLDCRGNALPKETGSETECGKDTFLIELKEKEQTFTFSGLAEKPIPSLLRNFSAPVIVHYPYDFDTLSFLFERDQDPFNRWEAGQRLMTRCLLDLIACFREGRELHLAPEIEKAFRTILTERLPRDLALASQLLVLPSEEYLADQMQVIDVEGIHEARTFMRRSLALAMAPLFLRLFEELKPDTPYRYDAAQAGLRQFKNLCLSYLAEKEENDTFRLLETRLRETDNMTDGIAALKELAHRRSPAREKVLEDFYTKWRQEQLVLDKWLAIQATAPLSDTLTAVRKLMQHPSFSIINPNRVRALIGSFCKGNPVNFHQKSGDGYRFLVEQVLVLDPLNSQIASRLLTSLSRWQRYDEERQALMRCALEKIITQPHLSRDCYEIAAKSLGRN
jgi:aminopeptidase N